MSEKHPTVAICTLGCKVNQYESEAIGETFLQCGFRVVKEEEKPDLFVVNTCTVTAEADRKGGQLVRKLHAENPAAPILLTGCMAQRDPARAAALPGVSFVCGNADKLSVVAAAQKLLKERETAPTVAVTPLDGAPFEPMRITRFDRTRAYVKIEDGCENRCTYCAIPAARGPVRSKPLFDVLSEVEGLTRGGCREVVLTGIETAAWGRDLGNAGLIDLLEAVDGIKGIGRVRLSSLDPAMVTEDFARRAARLSSLTPHFHLSVQSGSSRTLAAMKRKYNREMALSAVAVLKKHIPRVELTADFIVGFPGESEADFAETMSFARAAEFLSMHVFAYSKRAGTPAAAMPDQIPSAVKKQRSAALIALGHTLRDARLAAAIEKEPMCEVLFETYENGFAVGHTDSFFEVAAPSPAPLHGALARVRLFSAKNGRLYGEIETKKT